MQINFHDKIKQVLGQYKTKLCELSKDKNTNNNLISTKDLAYNFDAFTRKLYKNKPIDPPCSNDAFLLSEQYDYLIEFKNQTNLNITTNDLINKNFSSIVTLLAEGLTDIDTLKRRYVYLLVYNDTKLAPKDEMNKLLAKSTPFPKRLDYFKKHYFYEVKAFSTPKEFEEYYNKNIKNRVIEL